MNTDLLFDFNVDKEKKTVLIKREFDASRDLVWDAFTKQELLDQWWAPKPFLSKTKYMNFEVGGKRFYAMVGAEGFERWSLQEYLEINPKSHFRLFNVFTDKDENRDEHGSEWDLTFSEENGKTVVNIRIYNESLERMENLMDGFRLGMTATMKNLEELLESMK